MKALAIRRYKAPMELMELTRESREPLAPWSRASQLWRRRQLASGSVVTHTPSVMASPLSPVPPPPEPTSRERDLSGHIFSVSAGLVGVCLTVIGLFRLFRKTGEVASVADNLIAIDAMVFLFACLSAYLALRATREKAWRRFERFADTLFLAGLAAMVVISALIAYELV